MLNIKKLVFYSVSLMCVSPHWNDLHCGPCSSLYLATPEFWRFRHSLWNRWYLFIVQDSESSPGSDCRPSRPGFRSSLTAKLPDKLRVHGWAEPPWQVLMFQVLGGPRAYAHPPFAKRKAHVWQWRLGLAPAVLQILTYAGLSHATPSWTG